jgi:peptide/nickel transport system ATP-binding protein/oligopeptide transport system ATP-binding protein
MWEVLLKVEDLKTYFYSYEGIVKAVDGVDFSIHRGKTLSIVGESGCGKSVTALSIMRLVPTPPGEIVGGKIFLEGKNLLDLKKSEMRKIRGNKISMIFQEPMTSLNPLFSVGFQISEAIRLHQGLSKKEALDKSIEILKKVGIPSPEKRVHDYPHQMSGGMRQRVMIAMALSCEPALMIADEPTTALDVTIQAQILDIMLILKEEMGTSILLITHNLGVVAGSAQEVIVMYAGKIMEHADVDELFEHPYHPYTAALMKSIPHLNEEEKKKTLFVIPGMVPSLLDLPNGCKFNNRCGYSFDRCTQEEPPLFEVVPGHTCRCWLLEGKGQ